jgi:hypothetical protein
MPARACSAAANSANNIAKRGENGKTMDTKLSR